MVLWGEGHEADNWTHSLVCVLVCGEAVTRPNTDDSCNLMSGQGFVL